MPTAQANPRSVSPCRNGALSPYPASASTHPKRTLAAIVRSRELPRWDRLTGRAPKSIGVQSIETMTFNITEVATVTIVARACGP
jgi:hypothetical protein